MEIVFEVFRPTYYFGIKRVELFSTEVLEVVQDNRFPACLWPLECLSAAIFIMFPWLDSMKNIHAITNLMA